MVYIKLGRVVGAEGLPQQDAGGGDAGDGGQKLADPEGAPPQAVHPQSFDEGSAQAVPGGVAKGDLSVVFPLFA